MHIIWKCDILADMLTMVTFWWWNDECFFSFCLFVFSTVPTRNMHYLFDKEKLKVILRKC